MKQVFQTLFFAIFMAPLLVAAQDLSSFQSVANYTLNNTAADALGQQLDIELINAPFAGTDGVYCNGNYTGTDPDSTLVQTPPLEALYKPSFAVRVEFKIDPDEGFNRPVLVCGNSWRYLGFHTNFDSTWVGRFNDYTALTAPGPKAQAGQWYTLTMIYSGPDTTAYWYIDGDSILEQKGQLQRSNNDNRISNTHFGQGRTFKGHLRNLRIYQSDDIFSAAGEAPELDNFGVFPNPAAGAITITGVPPGRYNWRMLDLNGHTCQSGSNAADGQRIGLGKMPASLYLLRLTNEKTGAGQSRIFIKN